MTTVKAFGNKLPGIDRSAQTRGIIKTLPAPAPARYKILVGLDRESSLRADAHYNRGLQLKNEIDDAKRRLAMYQRELDRYGGNAQTRSYITEIQDEIAELEEQRAAPSPGPATHYVSSITRWLANNPGPYRARPVVLKGKGRNHIANYKALQDCITDLKKQIATLSDQPLTVDEAKRRTIEDLDKLAARGEPSIGGTFVMEKGFGIRGNIENQGHVIWPETFFDGERRIDAAALAAWINYDVLKAKLLAKCEKHVGIPALSQSERRKQRDTIKTEILGIEYEAAAFAFKAIEEDGADLFPAASVPALLGIERVNAKPSGDVPSSPDQGIAAGDDDQWLEGDSNTAG